MHKFVNCVMAHPLQTDMYPVPRYFEYEIVAGPGDAVQEWMLLKITEFHHGHTT